MKWRCAKCSPPLDGDRCLLAVWYEAQSAHYTVNPATRSFWIVDIAWYSPTDECWYWQEHKDHNVGVRLPPCGAKWTRLPQPDDERRGK